MVVRRPDAALLNRAAGALVGSAVGSARGAGSAGEWTDLTATTLGHLGDPVGLAAATPGEAGVVMWLQAIRHTVLTGELDARIGLRGLQGNGRERWSTLLAQAEREPASSFDDGGVVHAIQAAWSAIMHTPALPYDAERHLVDTLEICEPLGATVSAIAGALLGACHGVAAIPAEWAAQLPDADDLVRRARELAEASWAVDPDDELFNLPE